MIHANQLQKIIKLCAKYNSNLVFASSAAVYGNNKTPIKNENIQANPISPYGISKLNVEKLCEIYKKELGLKYTCFRNFNVYGPKQDSNSRITHKNMNLIDTIGKIK